MEKFLYTTAIILFFVIHWACSVKITDGFIPLSENEVKFNNETREEHLYLEAKRAIKRVKYDSALLILDSLEKILAFNENVDSLYLSKVFNQYGIVEYKLQNMIRAKSYFYKALYFHPIDILDTNFVAEIYFNLANVLSGTHQLDSAIVYYQKAFQLNTSSSNIDSLQIAKLCIELGKVAINQYEWDEAKNHLQKAISFVLGIDKSDQIVIGIAHNKLAEIEFEMDHLSQADSLYQLAFSIFTTVEDSFYVLEALNGLGHVNDRMGNKDDAIKYYYCGMEISKNTDGDSSTNVIKFLINIGGCFLDKGNYIKAEEIFNKALAIGLNIENMVEVSLAIIYANLGLVYEMKGDPNRALNHYKYALAVFSNKPDINQYLLAKLLENLGLVNIVLGKQDDALIYFNKCHTIRSSIYGQSNLAIAQDYMNMGRIYSNQGKLKTAIDSTLEGLKIYRNILGDSSWGVAISLITIADYYRKMGKYDLAIEYGVSSYTITEKVYGPMHPQTTQAANFLIEVYGIRKFFDNGELLYFKLLNGLKYSSNDSISILGGKHIPSLISTYLAAGGFYMNWYLESFNKYRIYQSFDEYKKAQSLLKWQRQWLINPESKSNMSREYFNLFEGGIQSAVLLNEITDSLHYLDQAFEFAQNSKSLELYESIQNSQAKEYSGIPDTLLWQENEIKREICYYESMRQEALVEEISVMDPKLLDIENRLFILKNEYNILVRNLESNYADYYKLKYNFTLPSVSEIQNSLGKYESYIEYFVGDSNVFIFVLNSTSVTVRQIKRNFPLNEWIEQFRSGIEVEGEASLSDREKLNGLKVYSRASLNLYSKLIAPIADKLGNTVIIVPDGELSILPFEALLTMKPSKIDQCMTYPYLIKSKVISYTLSGALFLEMNSNNTDRISYSSCLAMAPSIDSITEYQENPINSMTQRFSNSPLKYSGIEVKQVAQLTNGKAIVGAEATTSYFRQNAMRYSIVHLSQHGKGNRIYGDDSYLLFADKRLYARDIYNVKLNSEMVVLSACETAYGEYQRGEGLISMSRAFTYAGAKSVFATLWKVDDLATSELCTSFYKYLFKLPKPFPKNESLNKAKISLIKNNKTAHPYYWAAMIGIGNMDSLNKQKD